MKTKYLFVLLAMATMLFASSCSSDEDVSPSHADINNFAPKDDDNSELANLKRDFYKATNSYLLFNDTLSHVQIATDAYGNPIYKTENVNIDYDLVGQGDQFSYQYTYIKDFATQKKAAEFIKDKILPKLPGKRPFSILVVNDMSQLSYNDNGVLAPTKRDLEYNQDPYPIVHQGVRCLSISLSDGKALNDKVFEAKILGYCAFLQIITESTDFFKDFIAPVAKYNRYTSSWNYKSDFGYEEEYDEDLVRSLGFVQDDYSYRFPKKYDDRLDYATAVFQYTEPEFETEFANYPICIERYKIMRQMLLDYGFKLDD